MEHRSPHRLPPVTLVLGGARAGKSRHAEGMILASGASQALYIATAEAGDVEMATRIAAHRARRDARWTTVEAPLELGEALAAGAMPDRPVLIDCLTLWLSNLIHAGHDSDEATDRLEEALEALPCAVVMVSNEVGLGIVPDNRLARDFRDLAGRMNQRLAQRADRVVFVAAGLPLLLKDRPTP
ncbi:MAG: bifunctional adenosylcobinamide kinase/adenosylcobinamide-phosphate guanylyltransferase [Reyranellaceae bacterium]